MKNTLVQVFLITLFCTDLTYAQTTYFQGLIGPSDSDLNIRPAALNQWHEDHLWWVGFWTGPGNPHPTIFVQGALQEYYDNINISFNTRAYNYSKGESKDMPNATIMWPEEVSLDEPTRFSDQEKMDGMNDCDFNVEDIERVRQHYIQTQPFTSPWQKIAADLNHDGKISVLDFTLMRAVQLEQSNAMQYVMCSPWYYMNDLLLRPEQNAFKINPFTATIDGFSYPDYLWEVEYDNGVHYAPILFEYNEQWTWFHAVKMGHVNEWDDSANGCNVNSNDCYDPLTGIIASNCANDNLVGDVHRRVVDFNSPSLNSLDKDKIYRIDFKTAGAVNCFTGFQQGVFYDNSMILVLDVSSDLISFNTSNYSIKSDNIKLSWNPDTSSISVGLNSGDILYSFLIQAKDDINFIEDELQPTALSNFDPIYLGLDSCHLDFDLDIIISEVILPASNNSSLELNEEGNNLIFISDFEIKSIKIFNQMGLELVQSNINWNSEKEVLINMDNLQSGIYFIHVNDEKEGRTFRVVK